MNRISLQSFSDFFTAVGRFLWRRQTIYAMLFLLLMTGVLLRVSVIPEFAASVERATVENSQSLSAIAENPLYLPYKLTLYLLQPVSDSVRLARALSFVLLGLSIVALYRILKRWHSSTIALLATAMFATSATVLAVGRLGTPLVLLFSWPLIIALLLWVSHSKSKHIAPLTLLCLSSLLLYVPGSPYFFALLALLFAKKCIKILASLRKLSLLGLVVAFLVLVTPLVASFVQTPSLLREWLLLPSTIDWTTVWRNVLRIPSAFIYRTPVDPLLNIGRLPILDVASGALMLIGLYSYVQHYKLERAKVIVLTGLFATILGALGATTAAILILLPFIFIVIAAGITQLLDRWYSVFPRNPLARSFGLILVCIVVLCSIYYQANRFFIVWPLTPETRQVYNESRLVQ